MLNAGKDVLNQNSTENNMKWQNINIKGNPGEVI